VLITDPTVSRRHAVIVIEGEKCFVEDLGSTNGTEAVGKRLSSGERIEIEDGAVLRFGAVEMKLSLPKVEETAKEIVKEESSEEVEKPEELEQTEAEAGEDEKVEEATEVPAEVPVEASDVAQAEETVEEAPVEAEITGWLVSTTDSSVEFAIKKGANSIGRRAENDISLTGDPYVSGSHAELLADETGYFLTDVGSTNGTMVNSLPLAAGEKQALSDGDVVNIGQFSLRFESVKRVDQ
jgi:pSer/pThr/pTyr-binding forkhead associated (FHA) protein